MNLKLILLSALTVVLAVGKAEIKKDGNVYEPDSTNFSQLLKEHEFVLVEFFAPWCGHCQRLEPHYKRAANELTRKFKPKRLALAKVNCDERLKLKARYDYKIKGFPTIIWFQGLRTNPKDYDGGREDKDIVAWVDKQLGKATKREEILANPSASDKLNPVKHSKKEQKIEKKKTKALEKADKKDKKIKEKKKEDKKAKADAKADVKTDQKKKHTKKECKDKKNCKEHHSAKACHDDDCKKHHHKDQPSEAKVEATAALFTMEMILGILVVVFIAILAIVIRLWTNCKSEKKAGGSKKKRKIPNPAEFESLDKDDDEPIVTTDP